MSTESRAAFEAIETDWIEGDCPSLKTALLERDGDTYTHGLMRVKWEVWQASRKVALTEAMQVAGPEDAYQDEHFKAKADSVRRIKELLK